MGGLRDYKNLVLGGLESRYSETRLNFDGLISYNQTKDRTDYVQIFRSGYAFDRPKESMFKLVSPGGEPEVSREAVVNNISRMRAYKPNLDAQVAVIEAALINYFQTDKYNTHYIHGFPSPKLSILKDIYQADFAGLIVEIDNENIVYQRIYSDKVSSHYFHAAKVDFRKMENRFSILEFNLAKHVRST